MDKLLISSTGSPLVLQGAETRKPGTAGNSPGFRVFKFWKQKRRSEYRTPMI